MKSFWFFVLLLENYYNYFKSLLQCRDHLSSALSHELIALIRFEIDFVRLRIKNTPYVCVRLERNTNDSSNNSQKWFRMKNWCVFKHRHPLNEWYWSTWMLLHLYSTKATHATLYALPRSTLFGRHVDVTVAAYTPCIPCCYTMRRICRNVPDDDGRRTDCDALATTFPNQLCSATIGIAVASRSAG